MKTIIIDGIEYNLTPKVLFKKGDFVVIQETTYLISKIEGLNVTLSCNGRDCLFDIDVLKNARLWDITKDAKDGDVLYSLDSKQPFVFKHRKPNEQAEAYCGLNIYGKFFVWGTKDCVITLSNYIPATKEQRDLLFAKMKEAGYGWDTEKKKLKKLTQSVTKISDQDAWSYEDEANLNNIIWLCNNCINGSETTWIPSQAKKIKHLIETIKERGLSQQKPTEWNEEDEENLQHCCGAVFAADYYTYEDKQDMEKWLLQLKERIGG